MPTISLRAWMLAWALAAWVGWEARQADLGPSAAVVLMVVGWASMALQGRGSLAWVLASAGMVLTAFLGQECLAYGWLSRPEESHLLCLLGCIGGLLSAGGSVTLGALLLNVLGYLGLCALACQSWPPFLLLALLAAGLPILGVFLGFLRGQRGERILEGAQAVSWGLMQVVGGTVLVLAVIGMSVGTGGSGLFLVVFLYRLVRSSKKKS